MAVDGVMEIGLLRRQRWNATRVCLGGAMEAVPATPGLDVPSVDNLSGSDGLRTEESALIARVRAGDDRAFETLYARYRPRINSYVFGMVRDYGRAEDITQDVFISALRRIRETERPIAFKPWLYEIAKNACIDQFRRSKHTEEVSFESDAVLG